MKVRLITAAAGTVLLAWSALSVWGNTDHSPKPEKRNVPPTVYLTFPDSVQVKTVYIYPSEIAFRPLKGIKPHAKLNAILSNLNEQPNFKPVTTDLMIIRFGLPYLMMFPPKYPLKLKFREQTAEYSGFHSHLHSSI